VFLDRDGTLNRDSGYTHRVEDLQLLDNVVAGLQLMTEMGFRLIVTTNQSGIARGYFTEQEMGIFHKHMIDILKSYAVIITEIYYCPCHPTQGIGPFRRHSPSRKPAPGMLLQAALDHHIDLRSSYAIGDKKSDILAGQAAGCSTILVLTGAAGSEEPDLVATPDYIAHDLLDAALMIQKAELRTAQQ
jgi:D-glycero-D-manno-heptose 1,7-bisphosphate phosphatase